MSCSASRGSQTSRSLLAGPVRDLNVMTRNHRVLATVAIRDLSEAGPIAVDGSQVLVLLTGSAVVAGADGSRAEMHPLDAECTSGAHVRLVSGSGRAALVRIENYRMTRAGRSPSQDGESS